MIDIQALLIGAIIGLFSAIIGALIDYRLLLRRETAENGRTPGCMFIVSGMLGLLGLLVIIFSFLSNSVARAITAGVGVVAGFLLGFLLMMGLWFLNERDRA